MTSPSRGPASNAVASEVLRTSGCSIATPILMAMAPNPTAMPMCPQLRPAHWDTANFHVGPIATVQVVC
jgi:hypothetical protein